MNAQDIVTSAFRKIGITNPTATEIDQGRETLNDILATWSIEGLLIPSVTREDFTLTAGTGSYTIGSGGDFNTSRPIRIIAGYIRDSNTDYPLAVGNVVDYEEIRQKSLQSRPTTLFYIPDYPLGRIMFDMVPDKAYTFHLTSEKALSTFPDATTDVSLAPEYKRALIYNLAVELASEYDIQVQQQVFQIAQEAKYYIENYNASMKPPEEIKVDSALLTTTRYNIYTDS